MLRFHIIFAALLCLMWACGGDRALTETLDRADALMEEHPDSALALLRPYDGAKIRSEAQRARFALLYSMALDKNFIDTADFKVLQPALDYYPTHGTNADKLRTLYYEGRIYENADRDCSPALPIFHNLSASSWVGLMPEKNAHQKGK